MAKKSGKASKKDSRVFQDEFFEMLKASKKKFYFSKVGGGQIFADGKSVKAPWDLDVVSAVAYATKKIVIEDPVKAGRALGLDKDFRRRLVNAANGVTNGPLRKRLIQTLKLN